MKIARLVAAPFLCLLAASAAHADGPNILWGGPPGTPCGGIYSGFYLGGMLGGGSMRSKVSGVGGSISSNDAGFNIGEFSGYNVQCGDALIGIESEWSYFGADNEFGTNGENFGSSMNWFSALRGRVGIIADYNILIFATGGLAYSNVEHDFRDDFAPGGPFRWSDDNTQLGWTAGGGFEIFLRDHWTFRGDAQFVDLGTQDETFRFGDCATGPCRSRVTFDDSFWVARVGLTYLFSATAEPPAPGYYGPDTPEYNNVK